MRRVLFAPCLLAGLVGCESTAPGRPEVGPALAPAAVPAPNLDVPSPSQDAGVAPPEDGMVRFTQAAVNRLEAAEGLERSDPARAKALYEEVFKVDAARPAGERLSPQFSSGARLQFALFLVNQGDRASAEVQLKEMLKSCESIFPPLQHQLRQAAHYLQGDFSAALDDLLARRAIAASTPPIAFEDSDLAEAAELAVLAGRKEAAELLKEALAKPVEYEVGAVLASYDALLAIAGKDKARALKSVDAATRLAALMSSAEWEFQTLGQPFTGGGAGEECAHTFYESVRTATAKEHTPGYLLRPLQALRACVSALPETKAK